MIAWAIATTTFGIDLCLSQHGRESAAPIGVADLGLHHGVRPPPMPDRSKSSLLDCARRKFCVIRFEFLQAHDISERAKE
jgi:hypothetical protein